MGEERGKIREEGVVTGRRGEREFIKKRRKKI